MIKLLCHSLLIATTIGGSLIFSGISKIFHESLVFTSCQINDQSTYVQLGPMHVLEEFGHQFNPYKAATDDSSFLYLRGSLDDFLKDSSALHNLTIVWTISMEDKGLDFLDTMIDERIRGIEYGQLKSSIFVRLIADQSTLESFAEEIRYILLNFNGMF